MAKLDETKGHNLTTIDRIANFINDNPNGKIIFMVGAGISTSCGIPDFRSPKTGLYHNLSKLNLPFAEAVFDIDFFKENPKPFYTLAQELYPGKFKPSKFHFLMKLCEDNGHLQRVYTQNIDTLERQAGIEDKYVIEAHGSFASNHCIECNKQFAMEYFKSKVNTKKITKDGVEFEYAKCDSCQGLIKPNIVFFGENLPKFFFETWDKDLELLEEQEKGDGNYLVVVVGTSLAVYPFASLPSEVPNEIDRSLINLEVVGDFKEDPRKNDFVFKGSTDEAAELIAEKLDWVEELQRYSDQYKVETISTDEEMSKVLSEMEKLELDKENTSKKDKSVGFDKGKDSKQVNSKKEEENSKGKDVKKNKLEEKEENDNESSN